MATRMQQRRGTAAQWTSANPILAAGEIGFETDTGKFKMGNGSSAWSALSYFADASDFDTTAIESTIDTKVATAVNNLVAGAPEALNTLNELALAIDSDSSFAATVTTALSQKAGLGAFNLHTAATTDVHGIANTGLLETISGAQDKANAAQAAAEANASADATSKANAAQSAAETYADGLAVNYDPAGSAATAQTNAATYADSLAVNYDPTGSASAAQAAAQAYADGLSVNYDPAGAAAAAQAAAEATAASDATTKANAAKAAAEATAASELSAHNSDTTNVHGIADTSAIVLTDDSRLSDTRTPSDASVTDAKIDGTLSQSSITNLTTDLAAKAPLESPALTGTPTAPTATAGDNSTQVATTAYVETAVSNLVASAPGTLDTLNELAAALGDDPNFATTVTNSLALKLEQSDLDEALYYEFNAQASSYTLALSDSTNMVEVNSASGVTITVPPNSSVAFPVGSYIDIFQRGAGQVTIAEGSGVTVYATPGKKLRAQYSNATLIKRDTNTWILAGDIVA